MFSFSAVVITLLLFPALVCILILRLFFPKNTLKINDIFLFSFGLAFTLTLNLKNIISLADLLIPKCCINNEGFESLFFENVLNNADNIFYCYLSYLGKPAIIFLLAAWILKIIYVDSASQQIKNKEKYNSLRNRVFRKIKRFVNDNLVNYMGQMTVYYPEHESLFVDILDEGDSLYSGMYVEYMLDDKKFVGIKLSNVIRYSFKNDQDRMNEDDEKKEDVPYILPNAGEMYFPSEKIKNIHFWKIEKDHTEDFNLTKKYNQIRFAWMFGVSYSLPHLKIKVTGTFPEGTEDSLDVRELSKSLDKLNLDFNVVLPFLKIPVEKK